VFYWWPLFAAVAAASQMSLRSGEGKKDSSAGGGDEPDDLTVFRRALGDFQAVSTALDAKLAAAQRALESDFKVLDELVSAHAGQEQQYSQLIKMNSQIRANAGLSSPNAKGGKTPAAAAPVQPVADSDELSGFGASLEEARRALDRLKDIRSKTGSVFLRLMMGKVNVRMWKKSDQLQFKEEYDKFKRRTTFIFIIFPRKTVAERLPARLLLWTPMRCNAWLILC
jgi:hypothetical protein